MCVLRCGKSSILSPLDANLISNKNDARNEAVHAMARKDNARFSTFGRDVFNPCKWRAMRAPMLWKRTVGSCQATNVGAAETVYTLIASDSFHIVVVLLIKFERNTFQERSCFELRQSFMRTCKLGQEFDHLVRELHTKPFCVSSM